MRRREFITLLGGGAAAWPVAARGQQAAMPVIGYLSTRSPDESTHIVTAFRNGLNGIGYFPGRTWRSNIASPKATMIGCRDWQLISFAVR